jgi:hypothetical protein
VFLLLVSSGMLACTAVNSAGYFAQRRAWPMVPMFAVLRVPVAVVLALTLSP